MADLGNAAAGGALVGLASGAYMLGAGRIAGNSDHMKALVLGPREPTQMAFIVGMVLGGLAMGALRPDLFDRSARPAEYPSPLALAVASVSLILGGFATGLGTALGNGCTSGHGLCGLSRFSLRSLVATPTFLCAAVTAATLTADGPSRLPPSLLPIVAADAPTLRLALTAAVGCGGPLLALALLPHFGGARCADEPCSVGGTNAWRECALATLVGLTMSIGLTTGGMVRPSVVLGGLTPGTFDLTLWVLFVTALCVTFALYRVAQALGVKEAVVRAPPPPESTAKKGAKKPKPPVKSRDQLEVTKSLIVGEVLFGTGWGLTGFCPGPLLVAVAGAPQLSSALVCAAVAAGFAAARPVRSWRALV